MWVLLTFIILVAAVYFYTYPRFGHYLQFLDNVYHCYRAGLRKQATQVNGKTLVWLDNVKYREVDERPVLLLIHGFTADKQVWLKASPSLSKTFRLIVVDMPGHGDSEIPDFESLSVESLAKTFLQFMSQLSVDNYHISGNSLGGLVAAHMAMLKPNQVTSCILLNPAGIANEAEPTPFMLMMQNGINPFFTHSRSQFKTLYDFSMARPPFAPKVVIDSLADKHMSKSEVYETFFARCFNAESIFNDAVSLISVPTLLLFGMKDEIISTATIPYWLKSDHVEFMPFYDAGHMPMMEIAGRTSYAISFFVEKLKL